MTICHHDYINITKKIGRAGECAESCQQQKCYVWHANKEEGCLRG